MTGIEALVKFIAGEECIEIPNYSGYYISKTAKVYSFRGKYEPKTPKLLKQSLQNGYPSVSLYKTNNTGSGSGDTLYVHRLLAEAFLPRVEGKLFVNHKDGVKTNNSLNNLEWVTQQENNLHAFQNGLMSQLKYTKEQHKEILHRYHVLGERQVDIAKSMGVANDFVNDLISKGRGIKSQGLGDDIEKLLNMPLINPIKNAVKRLIWKDSEDCGCSERKEKLNKLFPYNRQPQCMNESEYNYWVEFKKSSPNNLSKEEADEVAKIWNRLFQTKSFYRPCTCSPSSWQKMIDDIDKIYYTYGEDINNNNQ